MNVVEERPQALIFKGWEAIKTDANFALVSLIPKVSSDPVRRCGLFNVNHTRPRSQLLHSVGM